MTVHLSARLAWHDSGWNGHICRNPYANTYCVGQYSFPGDLIATTRNLTWEQTNAGRPCSSLEAIPPCIHSINAFGVDTLPAFQPPPRWFGDGTDTKTWDLPPHTIATWPYEEMYRDEVKNPQGITPKYNAVARRNAANSYFSELVEGRSLIFYYTNYSNPFSDDSEHRYVITGVSRVKKVGPELVWENQTRPLEERYGPNVWMRNITSDYPDQGLRIPYHLYMDRPEVLERILFVPENARHFKYATRHLSDDSALGLIERFSEIVGALREMGDTTENWEIRETWLASVMAELWSNRGLYPGLLRVWDYLQFPEAIRYTKERIPTQGEQVVKDELFALLCGDRDSVAGMMLDSRRLQSIRKRWRYLEFGQQELLREILPRFDLGRPQIVQIIDAPQEVSVTATAVEVAANPYIFSEQYIGNGPDDQITFSQIDRGMLPSPDLGDGPGTEPDDWQRLRALAVEQLRSANQHTFLPAQQVLDGLNYKLSCMPEWKRAQFTMRHLEVEQRELSGALTYRSERDKQYVYLQSVFDDERLIERVLREQAGRPDIPLRFPVTEGHWTNFLTKPDSPLARSHPAEYERAIAQQVAVCQRIFRRPLSVLHGAAGTGKTTVVEAVIAAVEKAHGVGTSFQLLAPTGKAADRLRERTRKQASTIHAFLAQRGWLNPNLTFGRDGGRREESVTTFIIDESSMLDLPLLAAFFRAVNWNTVQRLIFIGDANQLPPIGTGKVFADLLDWLKDELPENVGELETNMRQIENRLTGRGTGILDLANVYVRRGLMAEKSGELDAEEEEILGKVQEGGDITGDLRVLYWSSPDELRQTLIETIVHDMEQDTGERIEPGRPDQLWESYFNAGAGTKDPERSQVISPYRGELFGIEHLNLVLQDHKNRWMKEHKGSLGGITYQDKVIQTRNRPKSDPLWAYDTQSRKALPIEVYNGEIGYTKVHGFDHNRWTWNQFRLEKFQVVFSRKQPLWVEYTSESDVTENLELAYAISVHKAQGSEFERVYFVLPKYKAGLLSRELFYTGLTRAQRHCTLLVQEDIAPILSLRRRENSHLIRINSSLFRFRPVPDEFRTRFEWYEEGKIHRTLANYMVRSKSEVIIANILFESDIPFEYEIPLFAPDGTAKLPDFTIRFRGEIWYWEHEGMLHDPRYSRAQEAKHEWYRQHGFADRLIITTEEAGFDSLRVKEILAERLGL